MQRVYKYQLQTDTVRATSIRASAYFRCMDIQVQDGQPVLWAEVDPEADQVEFEMYAVYTGQQPPTSADYRGTVVLGSIVIHYYLERLK